MWRLFTAAPPRAIVVGLAGVPALSFAYALGYLAVDRLMGTAVPSVPISSWTIAATGVIASVFLALFVLQATILQQTRSRWLAALRVHASNGFYVDVLLRRSLAARIAS
jgi:hypothetical protein